jgi:acyl-coenzyme A synthetase/AMP-(fatty) acid ligase
LHFVVESTLQGRYSDVINIGEVKLSPQTIDQFLLNQFGVIDCATVGVPNDIGIDELYTAIVISPEVDLDNLRIQLIDQMPHLYKSTKLVQLESIPHNATGKVLRLELKNILANLNANLH